MEIRDFLSKKSHCRKTKAKKKSKRKKEEENKSATDQTNLDATGFTAGVKHRSQVRSCHRSGQVTGQDR